MKAREKALGEGWKTLKEREEEGERGESVIRRPPSFFLWSLAILLAARSPAALSRDTRKTLTRRKSPAFLAAPTFLDNAPTSVIKVMFPRRREVTPTSTAAAPAPCLLRSSLFSEHRRRPFEGRLSLINCQVRFKSYLKAGEDTFTEDNGAPSVYTGWVPPTYCHLDYDTSLLLHFRVAKNVSNEAEWFWEVFVHFDDAGFLAGARLEDIRTSLTFFSNGIVYSFTASVIIYFIIKLY